MLGPREGRQKPVALFCRDKSDLVVVIVCVYVCARVFFVVVETDPEWLRFATMT